MDIRGLGCIFPVLNIKKVAVRAVRGVGYPL